MSGKGSITLPPTINEQCFLLEKAQEIYEKKRTSIKKGSLSRQINHPGPLKKYKTNTKYINSVTIVPKIKNFFQLKPNQIAQMVPFVTVSERYYSKGGEQASRKDILPSTNNTNFFDPGKKILQSTGERINGGIQSLNVTYEGIDSATRKVIRADAVYMFQDLRTLSKSPYSRLLNIKNSTMIGKKKLFRYLEFELGWSTNDKLNKSLGLGNYTLRLQTILEKYSLDIRDDGSVIVNASYRGAFIDAINGPASNILALAREAYDTIKGKTKGVKAAGNKAVAQANAGIEQQRELAIEYDAVIYYLEKLKQKSISSPSADHKAVLTQTMAKSPPYSAAQKQRIINRIEGADKVSGAYGRWYAHHADNTKGTSIDDLIKEYKNKSGGTYTAIQAYEAVKTGASEHAKEEVLRAAQLAKFIALRTLIQNILALNNVKYAYVSLAENQEIKHQIMNPDKTTLRAAINKINVDAAPAIDADVISHSKYQTIPYVFLGDLMNSLMQLPVSPGSSTKIHQEIKSTSGKTIYTDFGLVSYRTPYTNQAIKNFKLYYLPISLKKLNNFFANEIIGKEKDFFSYDDFLKVMVEKFLTGFFNVCLRESKSKSFKTPKIDIAIGDNKKKGEIIYFIFGSKNVSQEIGAKKFPFGKYHTNLRNKVYHFYLGGQRYGIVKSVKLSDVANATDKTAIYYDPQRDAAGGLATVPDKKKQKIQDGDWIPIVFTADITTLGFPLFNIGQLVYVDLNPFIKSDSRQVKATGYYAIKKVTHKFSAAGYETNIHTLMTYSMYQHLNPSEPKTSGGKLEKPFALDTTLTGDVQFDQIKFNTGINYYDQQIEKVEAQIKAVQARDTSDTSWWEPGLDMEDMEAALEEAKEEEAEAKEAYDAFSVHSDATSASGQKKLAKLLKEWNAAKANTKAKKKGLDNFKNAPETKKKELEALNEKLKELKKQKHVLEGQKHYHDTAVETKYGGK